MGNTALLRQLVFRIPEPLRVKFRMALVKNNLNIQQTMEALIEEFIRFSETGQNTKDCMKSIMKRSQFLNGGIA